ncbi:MAG: DUF2314 domain-containing protein [Bacteroidota bacterium]
MKIFLVIIIALSAFCSCNNDPGSKEKPIEARINKYDSADKMALYSQSDGEMNAAQTKARNSYPEFLNALQKKCKGCHDFVVKMRFGYGEDNGEHIWIDGLRIVDKTVWGIVANIPENIQNLHYGDTVEVVEKNISDWKYVQDGKLIGGYTLRVMYQTMSEEEKKQLESDLGAKIN